MEKKKMDKKTMASVAVLVAFGVGISVWDFMRGDILWGSVFVAVTLANLVRVCMKPAE